MLHCNFNYVVCTLRDASKCSRQWIMQSSICVCFVQVQNVSHVWAWQAFKICREINSLILIGTHISRWILWKYTIYCGVHTKQHKNWNLRDLNLLPLNNGSMLQYFDTWTTKQPLKLVSSLDKFVFYLNLQLWNMGCIFSNQSNSTIH